MKPRMIISSAVVLFILAVAGSRCLAAEEPGAEQAKDLLNQAVAYLEKAGPAKAFCTFNEVDGAFHKGPLYVFVINMDGVYFAHSAAPTLVGTSLRDLRDAAGQPFGKDIMEAIISHGEGSVDYMWLNYSSNKVEKKHSFVKRVGEFVLGVGYYTR